VPIIDDPDGEFAEHFQVVLSNPVNAAIADGEATVTILESDITNLVWDDGSTEAGSEIYAHPDTDPGNYVFRITAAATTVGAWRTVLEVTAGNADLYLKRGTIPTTSSFDHKSDNAGSDGLMLRPDQFSASEVWYILVQAQAGASWSLVTGEAFVHDLGELGYTDSNSDGNYDIGEPIVPTGTGTVAIGPTGIRFFRIDVPAGAPAWSLWLNGDGRDIALRKNVVPFHDPALYHDKKQAGRMLVVPDYLGSDLTTFFVSVLGDEADTVRLDARIQQIDDLAHEGSVGPVSVTGVPYRVYRVQVPVEQIAWNVTLTRVSGDPNVAVRRSTVPNEFANDGYSAAAGAVDDSLTLVPPSLVDGTWFITVHGDAPFEFSLANGDPVITPIDFEDVVVNDLTSKSGWRYYSVTDIQSQIGALGWELLLSGQVAGTEIAIRRNAVPGRWNYRTSGDDPDYDEETAGHVDESDLTGWLQQPGHEADIWYVGVYTSGAALGAFTLTTQEITPPVAGFSNSTTPVSSQPEGKWQFYQFTAPVGVLGWDVWVKTATTGNPRLVVRRDSLPTAVSIGPTWDNPESETDWSSGSYWAEPYDWTGYSPRYRRLVTAMGRPLEAGTYFVGIYNEPGSGAAAYSLVSRGIGAHGSGEPLEAEPLAFTNGSAAITALEPRDGRFFHVTVPSGVRGWQVKLNQTSGEMLLLARKDTVPNIVWREDTSIDGTSGSVGMNKADDEIFQLLPEDGASFLDEGDYYLAAVSLGQNPDGGTIGTGTASATIESIGEMPIIDLGIASETTITQTVSLAAGEIKLYQVAVPANTAVLEVVAASRSGNPRVSVVAGPAPTKPNGRFSTGHNRTDHYGWDHGQTTGRFFSEEYGTAGNPDVATVPAPPAGTYTIAVRANPVDGSDTEPDPATCDLEITAVGPTELDFAGDSVAVSGQLEAGWQFFEVEVPAGALGLDVWAKDVSSGNPQVVVRRDALPTTVGTSPAPWSYPYKMTTWPSGNYWSPTDDWSGYYRDPDGSDTRNRRLVAAVGRPLEPGTYFIGVYNEGGSGAASYTLLSRGIGADGSGCDLEAEPLAFTGGNAAITGLDARDGRFFKVTVPAGVRSWQVKVSQSAGELCLLARKGTVPNIEWDEGASVDDTSHGSVGMSKEDDEIYHLFPQDGSGFLEAGDYYLAVVSQGVNPGQPLSTSIGTGASTGTIASVGEMTATNLGTASATTISETVSLAAGEIKLYQSTVPADTAVLEVVATNRSGNPRVSAVMSPAAPEPNGRFTDGYSRTDKYGWDYGQTTGCFRNDEYGTGANPDVVTVQSPPAGLYTVAVRANPVDGSDREPDPAACDLEITAVPIVDFDFAEDSAAVTGQLEAAWRYFRVVVPAGALGLDVWVKDVTSGNPQLVVRRDELPTAVETETWNSGNGYTYWPSGNRWTEINDWSGYLVDPDGSYIRYRRLVAPMGRPLEPGTYYVGVYNEPGDGTAAYTLLSRGIGAAGSGCGHEVPALAFTGGSATVTNLVPRDGRFFKVTVPPDTRSWQVRLTQTTGECCLIARKAVIPGIKWSESTSIDNTTTYAGVGMHKAGDEIYQLLPKDGEGFIEEGDYFLAVVGQGVNPGQPAYNYIGAGTSTATIESMGAIPVADLGTASATPIVSAESLAAGEVKLYQFEVPAGAEVLEVMADNRVGNPRVSLAPGPAAPEPNGRFAASTSQTDQYGWDYGQTSGRLRNDSSATGNNPDVLTVPNPAAGLYTIALRANPVDSSDTEPDPATCNLKVRTRPVAPLNFDAVLNGGGGSHIATSQLVKDQADFYSVTVPSDLLGEEIIGWRLTFSHALGDTHFLVSNDFADWSDAVSVTGNSAVIVPPFLDSGETFYVKVIGDGAAEYTITSSTVALVLDAWTMPAGYNTEFGDSGAGLGGDQGRDLAGDNWHFYAVDVPDGNGGLLRTTLEALNGDPDLYLREDGLPTNDHKSEGATGGNLYDRFMTDDGTQYGNWVPLNGRTEHQLAPGRWYLGVKATGGSNARYRLRVSNGVVTDLALDGANLTNQQLAGTDWRFYRFQVPEDAPVEWSATFSQQQGDVVMHIRDTMPPGCDNDVTEYSESAYRNAYDDGKNQGPYLNSGYDAAGTHAFTTPWLRPGTTCFLGFHAKNDATFSLSTATAGGTIGVLPELAYADGTVDTTLAVGENLTCLVRVPANATRWKHTSTRSANVEIRIEQGTLPLLTGYDVHYRSSVANSSLDEELDGWPWVPGQLYYVSFVNTGGSPEPLLFEMNGKTVATEDEDGDGLPDHWELEYFPSIHTWGPMDAPGGDGVSNLMKLACNLDPTTWDRTILTPATGTRGLPSIQFINAGGEAMFRVEYVRRKDLDGVISCTTETSPGITRDWSPATGSETVTGIPGHDDWERVVVEIPADPNLEPEIFCRVRTISLLDG